ncbi:tyrosine-type recombinase/integrase [Christiangramia sp. SM2212]|uniref:Tyrosine-type recombinase/integrase n=1 Tax=Christiangramia sediminicola TaxID=3073267 RepID=A0ABU1EQY0_9FLAO|nr:tyrosine-type recombinase/integrase [Christiangramia sp. SM2212]MDR5590802.1 tyrosine-type recombinase/integrase [Christiangramia sp. SM2212]
MQGSTYIDFDKANSKGLKLIRSSENASFGLLIIVGINLGLRISDLLKLTYKHLRSDELEIIEQKTKKRRKLIINDNIKNALKYFEEYNDEFYAFRSQKNTVYSIQHVNRLMKKHFKGSNISSHSLRKTFGRRVWNNNNQSEKALMYLSELFGHHSISTTRKYLGIRQEELNNIYINL